ncbi:hypothetical protein EfmJHP38_02110 [Enterococcus faecium]|nr:hypothetical protein EfmJHP38_02110 [Enterococcus faecium]
MIIKEEIFVPKELVKEKIDLLVENLTTIKDDSEKNHKKVFT